MAKIKSLKTFQPDQGYLKEDWDAVTFPEMTDDELANARPAKEVLSPAFLKRWRSIADRAVALSWSVRKSGSRLAGRKVIATFCEGLQGRMSEALEKSNRP